MLVARFQRRTEGEEKGYGRRTALNEGGGVPDTIGNSGREKVISNRSAAETKLKGGGGGSAMNGQKKGRIFSSLRIVPSLLLKILGQVGMNIEQDLYHACIWWRKKGSSEK